MSDILPIIAGFGCGSGFEESLFRLAFSLAFFGALWLGELVSPSVHRAGVLHEEVIDLYQDRWSFAYGVQK